MCNTSKSVVLTTWVKHEGEDLGLNTLRFNLVASAASEDVYEKGRYRTEHLLIRKAETLLPETLPSTFCPFYS